MKSKEARWPRYVLIPGLIFASLLVVRGVVQQFRPPKISPVIADDLGKGKAELPARFSVPDPTPDVEAVAVENVAAPMVDWSCGSLLNYAKAFTEVHWIGFVGHYKGQRIRWDMKVEDVMTVGTGRFVLKATWEDPDRHSEYGSHYKDCRLSVQCAISRTLARDLSKGERIVMEGTIAAIFRGEAFGYTAVAVALEENATVIPR